MPPPSLSHTPRNKNKTNPLLSSKHFLLWPLADGSVIPTQSPRLSSQLCLRLLPAEPLCQGERGAEAGATR